MLIYVLRTEKNQKEPGITPIAGRYPRVRLAKNRYKIPGRHIGPPLQIGEQTGKFGGKRQNSKINLVGSTKRFEFLLAQITNLLIKDGL